MKYTDHATCINVTIYCPVNNAPVTIWKYNAWMRLASEHGAFSKSDLPSKFMMDIFISKQEAKALVGAADEDIVYEWQDTYKMPDSDDIQLAESAFVSSKRERAASSVKEPKSKKRAPKS